jgi:hypothetical protein
MKLLLFGITLFILSCKGLEHSAISLPNKNYIIPPGTIQVNSNLFLDQTEVSNFSYLEFYWFTKRLYGDSSEEFKTIVPNEYVWIDLGEKYYPLVNWYFMHPTYRNHPLVGITKEQAEKFCKWRTDRVMEYILLREGIIDHNPVPTIETCFTIEKYFSGNYMNFKVDTSFLYYPEYFLPDTSMYAYLELFQKINNNKLNKKNKKQLIYSVICKEKIQPMIDTMRNGSPPTIITWNQSLVNKKIMTHLKGNVRELTSTNDISYGGSYLDSCYTVTTTSFYKFKIPKENVHEINSEKPIPIDSSHKVIRMSFYKPEIPNCYTGFRCVCRYKKWHQD